MRAQVRSLFPAIAGLLLGPPAAAQGWESKLMADRMTGEITPALVSKNVGEGKWALMTTRKSSGLALILSTGSITECIPSDGCDLRVKIGDDQPRYMRFSDINNRSVAIRGSGARAIREGVAGGKKVLVEVPLYRDRSMIFTLYPDGFDNSFDVPKQ